MSSDEEFAIGEDGLYEIVDGKRVEKQMGSLSAKTAGIVGGRLFQFLETSPIGSIYHEQSYKCFPHAPGQIRRPDISFITTGRAIEIPEEGHIPIPPDLAIEIVSPNDTVYELDDQLDDYRAAGVKVVWVINPHSRVIRVYGPDRTHAVLGESDTLTGEPVLPGFSILVKSLLPPPQAKPSAP